MRENINPNAASTSHWHHLTQPKLVSEWEVLQLQLSFLPVFLRIHRELIIEMMMTMIVMLMRITNIYSEPDTISILYIISLNLPNSHKRVGTLIIPIWNIKKLKNVERLNNMPTVT